MLNRKWSFLYHINTRLDKHVILFSQLIDRRKPGVLTDALNNFVQKPWREHKLYCTAGNQSLTTDHDTLRDTFCSGILNFKIIFSTSRGPEASEQNWRQLNLKNAFFDITF